MSPVEDPAALLRARLGRWEKLTGGNWQPRLDLAEHAVRSGVPWAKAFGPPPPRPAVAQAWWDRLAVVAAYRDRWRITTSSILGEASDIGSLSQAAHRARAQRAGQEAARLAGMVPPTSGPGRGGVSAQPEVGVEL